MASFSVGNYVQHPTKSGDLIVHSDTGIVVVTDEVMKRFLTDLDVQHSPSCDEERLGGIFGSRTVDAIQFLKKYAILSEAMSPNISVNSLSFLTNNRLVGATVNSTLSQMPLPWRYEEFEDEAALQEMADRTAGGHDLVCVFLNPYSRRAGTIVRDAFLRSKGSYLLMSYTYNSRLYIDSLYCSTWQVPCHLCQISNIESDIRAGSALSYQTIVDQILNADSDAVIRTPLNPLQALNVATTLSNRLEQLIRGNLTLRDLRYGYVLDLNTLHVHSDVTAHWELCDCYA